MAITSNPKVSIALLPAQLAATIAGRTDLIVGTVPSGATAVAGQLYTDVAKLTNTQLNTLFGINSDIRNRIRQFLDANGGYSQLDVVALAEDGSATTAEGSITFGTGAGTATEDGEITISAVDDFQWKKTISVLTGDTDQDVVDAIVSAFSTSSTMPMVVAEDAINDYEVTFTSVDGGTIGNNYELKVEGSVAGLGTITLVQPTGGTNDADPSTIFDNLQSSRFTGINWPTAWISAINTVKTFLDSRFNTDNAILDGVAFIGLKGTFAAVKAVVDAQNSQSLCFGGIQAIGADTVTPSAIQPADWTMCYFQAVRARRLTQDAPIASQIVTTAGPLDAFGGPALASLPYFNTPMAQLSVVDPNDLYTNQEQVELEEAGFSVYGVNSARNGMVTGPMVTTWTTDGAGNPNESFHFLNYVDTASICREYFFNNLKARFSQSRLTNGTLIPGRSIENEESIRAEYSKIYEELAQLSLTVAGAGATIFFKDNLDVTIDLAQRKVTSTFQLPIVSQLGEIIVSAQLNFNFQEA